MAGKIFDIKLNLDTGDANFAANAMAASLSGVVNVAGTVLRAFTDTNRAVLESSRLVTDYRATLLELAALKGNLGNTTLQLKEDILFRARTGQTADAARALRSEALNIGQISLDTDTRKGVMSPAEFDKAMMYAGKFQVANSGDPGAIGKLIGNIPAFSGKERMTGEENYQRLRQYEKIMQLGGFSLSSGAAQAGVLSPYITSGMVGDLDAVSLMSLMSNSLPEKGASGFEQLMRASVGGLGRGRGANLVGMEGYDVQKTGEYLSGLGATPGMKAPEILRLISDDMASHEKDPGYDPQVYLQAKGYGNMKDRTALMTFHGRRKEYEEMYAPRTKEEQLPSFKDARADVDAAHATEPSLKRQAAMNLADVANIVEDKGGAIASYDALNRATFEAMRAEENWAVKGMKYEDLSGWSPWNVVANAQVNKRMMDDVNAKLSAAGLPAYEGQPGFGQLGYDARAKDFSILDANLRTRGISLFPDPEEVTGKAVDALDAYGSTLTPSPRTIPTIADPLARTPSPFSWWMSPPSLASEPPLAGPGRAGLN